MYYGQAGGKNFLLRKWRDLSDDIEIFCDGRDITPKIREHRVHSVLFSNIPHFSSGTRPWNNSVSLKITSRIHFHVTKILPIIVVLGAEKRFKRFKKK